MILRRRRRARRQQGTAGEDRGAPDHAGPPFGRTLTVRIIPAIM